MEKGLLISITGKDQPGLTAQVFDLLAKGNGRLLDIEQGVTRNLLTLSMLVQIDTADGQNRLIKELLFLVHDLGGLHLDFEIALPTERPGARSSFVITCLGPEVSMGLLAALGRIVSNEGFRVEKIHHLAQEEINCVEILVSSPALQLDPRYLSSKLLHLAGEFSVDIAVQEENLYRRSKRLIVMDMDSTLVQMEGIDELAKEAGVGERVAAVTHRAMNGEIAFAEALRERVRLLRGLPIDALERVYRRMTFTPGARELVRAMKHLGYRTAILSGGFDYFTDRIREELGLDYTYANGLEIRDGKLTGEIVGEIVDGKRKAALMKEIARKEGITLDQVIALGDGANDLPMITQAGLGIAFNAKPKVREQARYNITQKGLDSVLYLLGITQRDLEALSLQKPSPG